jgi:hypothetical protein
LREPKGSPRLFKFTGANGVRTEIVPPEFFWGMHMGWCVCCNRAIARANGRQVHERRVSVVASLRLMSADGHRTTILHMTCADSLLKSHIAATHGFKRDVDGLYSKPPRMLSLGKSLGGTQDDVAHLFRILVAAALASSRAVVSPLDGHIIGNATEGDGTVGPPTTEPVVHSRFLWSLVDLEPFLDSSSPVRLLEPNYPNHATPFLAGDAKALADLHTVRDLDLRPVNSFDDLVRRLDQPYYRCARSCDIRILLTPAGQGCAACAIVHGRRAKGVQESVRGVAAAEHDAAGRAVPAAGDHRRVRRPLPADVIACTYACCRLDAQTRRTASFRQGRARCLYERASSRRARL